MEKIIFSDENKIKSYDLKTKTVSILFQAQSEIMVLDVVNSSIFYIEENSTTIESVSETFKSIPHPKRIQPKAIAVDSLTKKIYILDRAAGTIVVIDMMSHVSDAVEAGNGSYSNYNSHGVVLSDLADLHDIVLDVHEGVMFVVQHLRTVRKNKYN